MLNEDMQESGVAAEELLQFVERIEKVDQERQDRVDDLKEIYNELGGRGFDKKAMRAIIKLRKQDVAERQEAGAILELYASAIGLDL